MSPLRAEIRKMASLAAPVAATQLAGMMIGFVDTAMVGRVSVEALGAVALANVWIYGTMEFAAGVVMGLAPIVAQAHGAGDGERAGRALQTGVLLAGLLASRSRCSGSAPRASSVSRDQDPELARIATPTPWSRSRASPSICRTSRCASTSRAASTCDPRCCDDRGEHRARAAQLV